MSLLSALKQMKQQTGSLDELASLPHTMIIQMARTGQIPKEQVLPIFNRKKELADDSANTQATQQSTNPPTVLEKILAAPQMQSRQMADMGVAQLPIREDMYAPQRMAGGGIVAFQNNLDQPVSEDMPVTMTDEERAYLEQNPYLRRSRAVANFGGDLKSAFTNPSNYNPINLYQQYVGKPFSEAVSRFANETPEQQAERFRMGQKARTGEIPMFVGTDLTTKGKMVAEGRMKPNENVLDVMKKEREQQALNKDFENFDKATALFEQEQKAKVANKTGNVSTKAGAKPKAEPVQVKAEEEPLYAKYEKMLMDERDAAKGAREEAKWSRMLEAGLGILGGNSQYAFENIGKGATPALKGYGEDVKGLRSEERGRVKELLGIEGMRQDAKRSAQDVDLKRQMIRVQEMAASKPSSTQEIIALGKSSGLSDREIMGMLSGAAKDPDTSARNIAMKAFYDSPYLQGQYKNDINAFLKAQGFGAGAGGQTVLNYVPGQGLK